MVRVADAAYYPSMKRCKFAIYPPATPDFPWLAVAIDRETVVDFFPCMSKDAADRVLASMKARWGAMQERNMH